MQEITQDENVQATESTVDSTSEQSGDIADVAEEVAADTIALDVPAKPKRQLPAGIKKIVDYLNAHEDIRQMVFFLMFSVLCGLSQMIVTYGLSAGLKLADSLTANFAWFIFKYDTTAEFIGFLVGSIVGQVLTFILNRKKTFNTPDHVAIRAVMYAILAILIILMQTALGGAVTSACYKAVPENEASEFLKFVFNLTGLAVGGIAAVVVNFLGNKFLVMRDWGKKKSKAAEKNSEAEAAQETGANADIISENDSNVVAAENNDIQN